MAEKSFFYKLGAKVTGWIIKTCENRGHKWKSYGTVRECGRCKLTQAPRPEHYFDRFGVEKSIPHSEPRNCDLYGHVTKTDSNICVECGDTV